MGGLWHQPRGLLFSPSLCCLLFFAVLQPSYCRCHLESPLASESVGNPPSSGLLWALSTPWQSLPLPYPCSSRSDHSGPRGKTGQSPGPANLCALTSSPSTNKLSFILMSLWRRAVCSDNWQCSKNQIRGKIANKWVNSQETETPFPSDSQDQCLEARKAWP